MNGTGLSATSHRPPGKTAVFLCSALLLLAGCPDSQPAARIQTERFCDFVFQFPAEEEKLIRFLGEQCGQIEKRVAEDLGLEPLGEIRVQIASTEEEFRNAWPGQSDTDRWAAARASPREGRILMKSPKLLLGGQHTYNRIFLHEVAHIALYRALAREEPSLRGTEGAGAARGPYRRPPDIPRWLHEGYAEYLSRQWSPNQEVLLSRAVLGRNLIPLGRLVSTFPAEEGHARLAYAESADLVHYLIRRYGEEDFHRFLEALSGGNRFGNACREVFGKEFLQVEQDWKKHLRRRYSWLPLIGSTGTLWFVATLVFITAYVRKKISTRAKLRKWSEEDPL